MEAAPEIPWADIRGMRNRVAHEYFGIDVNVLWQTVREDLPHSWRRCDRSRRSRTFPERTEADRTRGVDGDRRRE
jgi:uncharacterized protein with HEPN domain